MPTPNLGEATATVWENRFGGKPRDVIHNSRAFFFSLAANGFKQIADGGRLFEFLLEFAENTNFHSVSEMEQLDTSRINVFDAARFTAKIAAGTLVISNLEELRASGKSNKLQAGLMAEKMENAKDSHTSDINRMCLGSASTGKDWNGIQHLISITPTTGTVGGISRDSFSFHRNRQASGAQSAAPFDNLRKALTSIYNQCSLGGVKRTPRWVQANRTEFEGYETILVAIEQIAEARMKQDSDIAFKNEMLKFKGAKMFFDEDAVAGEMRLYQNEDLKLVYYKDGWFKLDPKVDPHNQLANVHKLATFGQLCIRGSRHLGVVSAIT
ncbi:hypothetical protein LCGC14_0609840 [marine sediment metagenome]|uniref:Bacteriophage Mu GpT domain-containing protein n=1 Tax=marine sediment metagenome TaxID=412755 RepID=A0A0F9UGF4_9ZZZZ